jgi:uncharacterized membrane protein
MVYQEKRVLQMTSSTNYSELSSPISRKLPGTFSVFFLFVFHFFAVSFIDGPQLVFSLFFGLVFFLSLKAFMRVFCQAGFTWCCQQLGIETKDVDEVKVFSKNLELVTQFFYAAVLAYQDRFLLEHPGDFGRLLF